MEGGQEDPFDFEVLFHALPTPYVVMTPDLAIVQVNPAYLLATGRRREDVVGRPLFEAFPPAQGSLDEHGQLPAKLSLERVAATGHPETLPVFRYDIAGPDGTLAERHWLLAATPVLDNRGRTAFVVQRTEDLTDFVRERERGRQAHEHSQTWRRRVEQVEADLFAQAKDLSAALAAREAAARQASALAEVALALRSAQSVEDVEQAVFGRGLSALGANGGAVVMPSADGRWRLSVNAALGDHVQVVYGDLPYDSPLPAIWTARSGKRLLLATRASGLAFTPEMAQVYKDTKRHGWAFLPMQLGERTNGCLAVSWLEEHEVALPELELLEGLAAQCSQALLRLRAVEQERRTASQVRLLAEELQQALLTPPPQPPGLHIAARYRPAADQAQVGGDWYDAFVQPHGATMLVVGDVVGHDSRAAASMGQLRGLLRGLAYDTDADSPQPPSGVLTRLEHVAQGLDVSGLATVVLARVEPSAGASASRQVTWSNAGHLPPLMVHPDGASELLDTSGDLLLGVDPDTVRHDHTVTLSPGATLMLFTDGLVERRAVPLDQSLAALQAHAAQVPEGASVEDFCDQILFGLVPKHGEDDVAFIALRS